MAIYNNYNQIYNNIRQTQQSRIYNIQQGLSRSDGAYNNLYDNLRLSDGMSTPPKNIAFDKIKGGRNFTATSDSPNSVVDAKVSGNSISQLQFPQDLGKYQFVIIESNFVAAPDNINNSYIKFGKMYKLPIPVPLNEHYTTNYDENFNLLSKLAEAVPGGDQAGQLIGNIATSLLNVSGLSVNTFKTVTLKNPSFRTHDFNWKLSPKNFQESVAVRDIIFGLKRGMSPILTGGRTLFAFPSVFIMFFVPNIQFLYKFKPCVLQQIEIDYLGNNPSPAFYGNGDDASGEVSNYNILNRKRNRLTAVTNLEAQNLNFSSSSNPPESVVIKTRWLELEYWVQQDFDRGGANSTNPLDVFNWYTNQTIL